MSRTTATVVAALLVVGTLAAFPVAGLAAETETEQPSATETGSAADGPGNASVAPGAQLAGVVGVGQAELEGDVESRAYGIQVAQSKTNDSKAAVVAERLATIEQRLRTLHQEKRNLSRAHANGSMSDGEYRAKMAGLHARTKTTERLANETNETAQGLPAEELREKGINATAIRTLKENASELSGPEVAEIARSIAGEGVGQSNRPDHAGERGEAPTDVPEAGDENRGPGNASDDASDDEATGGQDDANGNGHGNGQGNGQANSGDERDETPNREKGSGDDRSNGRDRP